MPSLSGHLDWTTDLQTLSSPRLIRAHFLSPVVRQICLNVIEIQHTEHGYRKSPPPQAFLEPCKTRCARVLYTESANAGTSACCYGEYVRYETVSTVCTALPVDRHLQTCSLDVGHMCML